MKETSLHLLSKLHSQTWMIQIFVVLVLTGLIAYFTRRFLKRWYKKAKERKAIWEDIFVDALTPAVLAFIWILGITHAGDVARQASNNAVILNFIEPLRDIGIVFSFTWFLLRFVRKAERNYLSPRHPDKSPSDITTVQAISKLLRISVMVTSTLVTLQTLGFSVSGVLAFGGIGGVAIGFAAKDLLANFFGGLMLYMDRPFKVGDWINSPDKNIEGTVEEIGWRLTRIRTFDKRPLYVPNALFSTIAVINPSRMSNRRIKTVIGVRYDDWQSIEAITQEIEAMLQEHPEIDTKLTCFVKLIEFGESSLNLLVYTFTKTTQWVKFQGVQQDVFIRMLKIIEKHGAECAFPTRTVDFPHFDKFITQK
ncbi:MAG: mechanosensitive ion channel protein MscS [marine bacterium B5-7]|nr:MAG: mechanosensitive ion channel protein MscS [marine bacterium B5-7]